ncbi:hypothetical protein LXL04_015813 [Taraxacum kok-saghyz]
MISTLREFGTELYCSAVEKHMEKSNVYYIMQQKYRTNLDKFGILSNLKGYIRSWFKREQIMKTKTREQTWSLDQFKWHFCNSGVLKIKRPPDHHLHPPDHRRTTVGPPSVHHLHPSAHWTTDASPPDHRADHRRTTTVSYSDHLFSYCWRRWWRMSFSSSFSLRPASAFTILLWSSARYDDFTTTSSVSCEELNNEEEKFDQAQPQSELQNEVNNVELNNDQMELEQLVDHEKAQSDGNNDASVSLDLDDHEPSSVELNNVTPPDQEYWRKRPRVGVTSYKYHNTFTYSTTSIDIQIVK